MKSEGNIRNILCAIALVIIVQLFTALPAYAENNTAFVPDPQTAYAKEFIKKCENEVWFMDLVEPLLNAQQKSINTLANAGELDKISSIGAANRNIVGKIPPCSRRI